MDDALFVCRVQGIGHSCRDAEGFVDRELPLTVEPVSKSLALDVRHDVVQETVRLPRVVKRQDVRMLEVGRRLDLGQEAVGTDDRSQLRPQDLERDLTFVPEVPCRLRSVHARSA